MFATILLIVLALVIFAGILGLIFASDAEDKAISGAVSGIALVVALVVGFFSMTATVQAKEVGVLTTFGKPAERTLEPGLSVKAPWQKVTTIDSTVQTNEYNGDNAIKVILSDKNTADISATIRWSVADDKANEVFSQFRERKDEPVEELRKSVVSTQFKAAMNSVFNSYDAVAEKPKTPEVLADEVKTIVESKAEGLVEIKSVTISYIKPDAAVQKKIDALQTQRGATKVALEREETAKAEARANKALAASISDDPNVLVNKCLDIVEKAVEENKAGILPSTFSCGDSKAGVIVQTK